MIEYRFSADDELDDFEDSAEVRLDDEMGEYGLDDDDDEVIEVITPVGVLVAEVVEVESSPAPAKEPPAARKPAAKAATPKKAARKPPQKLLLKGRSEEGRSRRKLPRKKQLPKRR